MWCHAADLGPFMLPCSTHHVTLSPFPCDGRWVVSSLGLLRISLVAMFLPLLLGAFTLVCLLGVYSGVQWLDHTLCICSAFVVSSIQADLQCEEGGSGGRGRGLTC